MPKTLVVSNRLPVTIGLNERKYSFKPSTGGLATCLKMTLADRDSLWIGWPGCFPDSSEHAEIETKLKNDRISPVFLNEDLFSGFYRKYANGVLWPSFHYLIERMPLIPEGYEAYKKVNHQFADTVVSHYREGDSIWIHDYHLLLLPSILRLRLPHARIGFFLHIPFPSSDVFRVIPQHKELLAGLCGANLIGFHCPDYVRHFKSSMRQMPGFMRPSDDRYVFSSHNMKVGCYPISVYFDYFDRPARNNGIRDAVDAIKSVDPMLKVLLAVDRLDYTKGVLRRLLAYERLLASKPMLRRKVILVQIAAKTRMNIKEYRTFKKEVDECVGRINGEFGEVDYQPVHHIAHSYEQEDLIELYKAADVMLVTPIRDGMNLVGKEFVASRTDEDGVLVLSELAGAAVELKDAVMINPYDIEGTADALFRAVTMEPQERTRRMRALRQTVRVWQNTDWATSFLTDLGALKQEWADSLVSDHFIRELALKCAKSDRLNFLLDYDGTLVPIAETPKQALPGKMLTAKLAELAKLSGVSVHIISGRKKEDLEDWFGSLPIFLHGEHGAWSRTPLTGSWTCAARASQYHKNKLLQLAYEVSDQTPGSFVEEKTFGFAWHYRNCDPELARESCARLKNRIQLIEGGNGFEVVYGKKVLEVRPKNVSKGHIVMELKKNCPYAVNVAFGDDDTDEHMFKELGGSDVSVHIGDSPTIAAVKFKNSEDVHAFLDSFISARSARDVRAGSRPIQ